jgi:hypothetical protein
VRGVSKARVRWLAAVVTCASRERGVRALQKSARHGRRGIAAAAMFGGRRAGGREGEHEQRPQHVCAKAARRHAACACHRHTAQSALELPCGRQSAHSAARARESCRPVVSSASAASRRARAWGESAPLASAAGGLQKGKGPPTGGGPATATQRNLAAMGTCCPPSRASGAAAGAAAAAWCRTTHQKRPSRLYQGARTPRRHLIREHEVRAKAALLLTGRRPTSARARVAPSKLWEHSQQSVWRPAQSDAPHVRRSRRTAARRQSNEAQKGATRPGGASRRPGARTWPRRGCAAAAACWTCCLHGPHTLGARPGDRSAAGSLAAEGKERTHRKSPSATYACEHAASAKVSRRVGACVVTADEAARCAQRSGEQAARRATKRLRRGGLVFSFLLLQYSVYCRSSCWGAQRRGQRRRVMDGTRRERRRARARDAQNARRRRQRASGPCGSRAPAARRGPTAA